MTAAPAEGPQRNGDARTRGISAAAGLGELGVEAERARTVYGEGAQIMCDRLRASSPPTGSSAVCWGPDRWSEGQLTAVVSVWRAGIH